MWANPRLNPAVSPSLSAACQLHVLLCPLLRMFYRVLRWLKLRAATSQEANDLQVQMFLEYLKLQVGSGSRHTCTCSALGAVCTHVMLHLAPQ